MSRVAIGWTAIAFALALTVFASTPWWSHMGGVVEGLPGKDKTGHFVIMGLLAGACVVAFVGRTLARRHLSAVQVLALVSLGVTVDEFVQAIVPSRTFDLGDLVASLAGILVIGGGAALVQKRRQTEAP